MRKPATAVLSPSDDRQNTPTLALDSIPQKMFELTQAEQRLLEQEQGLRAFADMRESYKTRYEAVIANKTLLNDQKSETLEQMWARLWAEPQNPVQFAERHYKPSLQEISERSNELLAELQGLLLSRAQVLTSWRNLLHEVSYRLHLLQKVEEELSSLEQGLSDYQAKQQAEAQAKQKAEELAKQQAEAQASSMNVVSFESARRKSSQPGTQAFDRDGLSIGTSERRCDTLEMQEEELLAMFDGGREANNPALEKRKHTRLVLGTVVSFSECEHSFYTGFSENISEGGLFIATYAMQPQIGEQFHLNFTLPDKTVIDVLGEVAWVREHSPSNPNVSPGFGCRFLNLTPQAQAVINSMIEEDGAMFMP